ncbi:MAG: flagellar basal body rod protein FlgC [Phycisphaerales bacterium]|nr:flagellar basal body rod protein FlgC [Phycisphaerales bacterium]
MMSALDISASALNAQRTRMDIIAGNIANAYSTRQEDGTIEPFRRRLVALASGAPDGGPGVRIDEIALDESPFVERFQPGHPDARVDGPRAGYVRYPNVSISMEYVDALEASRAYEANVAMMNVSKGMVQQALRLFA